VLVRSSAEPDWKTKQREQDALISVEENSVKAKVEEILAPILAGEGEGDDVAECAGVPEYPAFSSRLPSFEYSVYECTTQAVFASGLDEPTGLALADGVLYVAEHATGAIVAFGSANIEWVSRRMVS